MLRVGLTGGMGAGKSTVADAFSRRGAMIIDSDRIAREVVEPGTEGLAALVEAFGPEILSADGSLNRPALAAIAFASDDSRKQLNGILHPRIGRRTGELLASAAPDAVVVQDIPLLVENALAPMFHLVVIVDADVEVRVQRLVEHRGVDEADARARIAAQATEVQRRAVADVWIDNSGTSVEVAAFAEELYRTRIVAFERNLREGIAPEPAVTANEQQASRIASRVGLVVGAIGGSIHDSVLTVPREVSADQLDGQMRTAGFVPVAGGYRNADPDLAVQVEVNRA